MIAAVWYGRVLPWQQEKGYDVPVVHYQSDAKRHHVFFAVNDSRALGHGLKTIINHRLLTALLTYCKQQLLLLLQPLHALPASMWQMILPPELFMQACRPISFLAAC